MIIHADMDAFYASVEIRDKPELRNLPVAVGGGANQRGVISAANYIARRFRIHSALPTKQALQRCPDLVLLPGRMDVYVSVSQQIHEIFYRYTPLIEPLSLDEAFLDVSQSEKLFKSALDIGKAIKRDVLNELKLVISVGIANNKFTAKIASDVNKPDGFVYVEPGQEQKFLDPLPISRIWGIGKHSNEKLNSFGVQTIKQLRQLPEYFLEQQFGKHGEQMRRLANGIDPRQVESDHKAKSISQECTFAVDISDPSILLSQLSALTEQVAWRLRNKELRARTIQLKIRFADFSSITRSQTIATASNSTETLYSTVKFLFEREHLKFKQSVRLIGMGAAKIEKENELQSQQQDLFQGQDIKQQQLDTVADQIKHKFGISSVSRGASIKSKNKK